MTERKTPKEKSTERPGPSPRSRYLHFSKIQTRWNDNDVYGHINNVVYYSYFDSAVNLYLIEENALDIATSNIIGLVAETKCNFFAPSAYPEELIAGLRTTKIGETSVRYEIGIFGSQDETSRADGHFIHVYVDRDTNRPTALPEALRKAVEKIQQSV